MPGNMLGESVERVLDLRLVSDRCPARGEARKAAEKAAEPAKEASSEKAASAKGEGHKDKKHARKR